MIDRATFFVSDLDSVDPESRSMYEPDGSGGYRLPGAKPVGEMSEAERIAFVEKHGAAAYSRLVRESAQLQRRAERRGAFGSDAESMAYIERHGIDAFRKRLAAGRGR